MQSLRHPASQNKSSTNYVPDIVLKLETLAKKTAIEQIIKLFSSFQPISLRFVAVIFQICIAQQQRQQERQQQHSRRRSRRPIGGQEKGVRFAHAICTRTVPKSRGRSPRLHLRGRFHGREGQETLSSSRGCLSDAAQRYNLITDQDHELGCQQVFPKVKLLKNVTSNEYWSIDHKFAGIDTTGEEQFTLCAAGLKGSVTSKRSHLVMIDDAIKSSSDIGNPDIRKQMEDNWNAVIQL